MSFSTKKYVWGIKITLNQAITEDTSIGLYDNAGLSEFRWITNSASTTLDYKDGVLAEGGIGTIGQESDFTIGGNVATVKGFECTIAGSFAAKPTWEIIRDAGINLVGKQIQVIEFDISTDPATETVLRTFVIDKINSWNEESYSFECVSAYHKRNTYISEQDELGNVVPVLFGENILCKLSEIKNDSILDIKTPFAIEGGWPRDTYPIIAKQATTNAGEYTITISLAIPFLPSEYASVISFLDGKIIKIVSGGGEGQYRKLDASNMTMLTVITPITNVNWYVCLTFVTYDVLDEIKVYTDSNASFIQFLDFSLIYNIDSWPCSYRVGEINKLINDVLSKQPTFPYSLDSDNNQMIYNATFFQDTSNVADNILFASCRKETENYSILYGAGQRILKRYTKNGFYRYDFTLYDDPTLIVMGESADLLARSYDRIGQQDDVSYLCSYRMTAPTSDALLPQLNAVIHTFQISNTDTVEDAYLGINFKLKATSVTASAPKINFYVCPFTVAHDRSVRTSATNLLYDDGCVRALSSAFTSVGSFYELSYNNIPSDYYSNKTEVDTFSKDGFSLQFVHKDSDQNKTIRYGFIIMQDWDASGSGTIDFEFKVYEAILMLKRSETLGGEIFSVNNGRIFNDTWTNRKTAANLIEAPTDIIEHVKRLERNDIDDIDFGHKYSPSVSIDTDTFDSTELVDIQNVKAGRQITSESDQWTGKITESICKEFYLCNYQNNLGQECISNILRNDTAPTVAITFSDIIPDSLSSVEELGVSDIYCEPFVSYAFNPAYDKYDKQIKITNTHKATFDAAYVIGLAGGESERLWNLARALYLKYGTVTQPPEDKTNLLWIYQEADAVNLLSNWLTYMGAWQDEADGLYKAASRKRLSFSVSYDIAMTIGETRKPWFVSMKLSISFPYHTSNETVYCIVENVEFDIEDGIANITVLTYDVTNELQFYIKNTFGASDDGTDWKKTYLTKAEAPTNGNDIKNNT